MNHPRLFTAVLLMCVAAGGVCAEVPPAPPVPPDETPAPTNAEVGALLDRIHDHARWDRLVKDGDALTLSSRFDELARFTIRVSNAGLRDDADRLCAAIVDLHAGLPAGAVHAHGYVIDGAFVRDGARMGGYRLKVAQYFAPPADRGVVYRFSLDDWENVVQIYSLESSQHGNGRGYVLIKQDLRTHTYAEVQRYGDALPDYWRVRQRVLDDLGFPGTLWPLL